MKKLLLVLILLTACVEYESANVVEPTIYNITIEDLNRSENKPNQNNTAKITVINETNETENKTEVNETPAELENETNETIVINDTNHSIHFIDKEIKEVEIGSQVIFWLGTRQGAFKDILSEGETQVYDIYGDIYEVTVVFIGEGDDGLGEALFQVNGRLSKALGEKESDILRKGEFIYVREVHYRRTPVSFKVR